jgi:hypothetical protein
MEFSSSLVPCPLSLLPSSFFLLPSSFFLVPCPLSLVPCPFFLVPRPLSLVPLTPPRNLRPIILQRHRPVKNELCFVGILIHTKIPGPLKLVLFSGFCTGQSGLCLGNNGGERGGIQVRFPVFSLLHHIGIRCTE